LRSAARPPLHRAPVAAASAHHKKQAGAAPCLFFFAHGARLPGRVDAGKYCI